MTEATAELAELKASLRREAAARRAAIPPERRHAAAGAVARHAASIAPHGEGAVVSGYAAIGDELDAFPALAGLHGLGITLALPVVVGRGAPLLFRRWRPGDPLTASGRFAIREPSSDAAVVEPGILLVPLLAFDESGNRLGYGAGHYDRTLAALRARGRVLAVGLAFEAQRAPRVPVGPRDQPLDCIVTEEGVVFPRGAPA